MESYDDCIIFLLAKAYQKAHKNLKRHVQAYGLTPIQCLILQTLCEEEGISAGELGKRIVLDNATLSGVLERMAEKGWVVKKTDEDDKRYLKIYLSDRAKDLVPTLAEKRKGSNDEILGAMSLEEKVLFRRLLRDVQG